MCIEYCKLKINLRRVLEPISDDDKVSGTRIAVCYYNVLTKL